MQIWCDVTGDVVIRAERLGKMYVIGHEVERKGYVSYVALRDVLARAAQTTWRKTLNMASGRAIVSGDATEEFWALKNVNFEIKRGEVVGIVGRNGAGKSTLLKVLSRITEPTEGRVTIDGRVASLLEVGTGFHPELSGRENIYLNGAILGMTRSEIKRKFDEIVAFAEIERFLDTPVKRYSSGMYVRLAFAVAAHLEPEILVVDEVLAVGDAEFQRKCLGKMNEVAGHGRTVLFVSHNIGSLLAICNQGILLEAGRLNYSGKMEKVAERYRSATHVVGPEINQKNFAGPLKGLLFDYIRINGRNATPLAVINSYEEIAVTIGGFAAFNIPNFIFAFALYSSGVRLLSLHDDPKTLEEGRFEFRCFIPAHFLRPELYSIALGGKQLVGGDWTWAMDVTSIEILPNWNDDYRKDDEGLVNLVARPWRTSGMKIIDENGAS